MDFDNFLETVRRYTDAATITKRIPAKESPSNTSQSRKQHNEKEQATCLLPASNRIRIEKSSGHK